MSITAVDSSLLNKRNDSFKNINTTKIMGLNKKHSSNNLHSLQKLKGSQEHLQNQELSMKSTDFGNLAIFNEQNYKNLINLIEQHQKFNRNVNENPTRYKTELCRPFEESGTCKYGDKCQFAHGCKELRDLDRHPKYKTELCRTYHKTGFCPYGPRCHFVHNFEEARINQNKNDTSNTLAKFHQSSQKIDVTSSFILPQATIFSSVESISQSSLKSSISLNQFSHQSSKIRQAIINSSLKIIPDKPHLSLSLSPSYSLDSSADSISPASSLSQSPTNSSGSFFGDERVLSNNSHAINLVREFCLLENVLESTETCQEILSKEKSMENLSCSQLSEIDSRLPIFNKLSKTIDFLK